MKSAVKVLIIIGMMLRCVIPILGIPALVVGISAIKKLGVVRDIGMIRKWGVAGSAGQAGEEDIRSKD